MPPSSTVGRQLDGDPEVFKPVTVKKPKKSSKNGRWRLKGLHPFSFFDREEKFRASQSVKERDNGFCRVRKGIFGLWRVMYLNINGSKLECRCAGAHLRADRLSPQADYTINLVGTKLSVTGSSKFVLKHERVRYYFTAPSVDECGQWLYKFQKTPGMHRSVEDFYKIGNVLGEGATCLVKECESRLTGNKFAYKVRVDPQDEIGRHGIYNELRILQIMNKEPQPGIPLLEDFFYDKKGNIEVIMELLDGGELLRRIAEHDHFSENAARRIFKQLTEGVLHLHKNGIAHRDLKPSNIMYTCMSEDSPIKIIDYDLAKENYARTWYGGTPVGTTDFMAPEVIQKQRYTLAIDMWSLGCILYMLLSGDVPFRGADSDATRQNIVQGIVSYDGPIWEQVSDKAKSLLKGLLEMDAGKRLTAEQSLVHPWMTHTGQPSMALPIQETLTASLSSNHFHTLEKLHKEVVLMDVPDGFITEHERQIIHNRIARRSRPNYEKKFRRLRARLLSNGCLPNMESTDIEPGSPALSEADQSIYASTCQRQVFLNAFGSAPDLGILSDADLED